MNVMDSLKNFFMPADEDEMETPKAPATPIKPSSSATSAASAASSTTSYSRVSSGTSSYEDSQARQNERYATIKATAQFQVILVKATTYTADSKKVADYLMQNKTVVLNLEDIDDVEKRRIIDFVVGAAYAMHGRIRPIANQTFLIIPQNVGFDGDDIVGELQGSGLV
ncbi:MAG: cell division protein SepF [Ruminococcus sp.]|nr:cell division protein SepF [Ruminococcus sp.]